MNILSIAHRDIKPQNILVDRNTHKVVVCDFGSAKKLQKGNRILRIFVLGVIGRRSLFLGLRSIPRRLICGRLAV